MQRSSTRPPWRISLAPTAAASHRTYFRACPSRSLSTTGTGTRWNRSCDQSTSTPATSETGTTSASSVRSPQRARSLLLEETELATEVAARSPKQPTSCRRRRSSYSQEMYSTRWGGSAGARSSSSTTTRKVPSVMKQFARWEFHSKLLFSIISSPDMIAGVSWTRRMSLSSMNTSHLRRKKRRSDAWSTSAEKR